MDNKLPNPTGKDCYNEGRGDLFDLEVVEREVDDGWRHGCNIWEVYHRKQDDTYWSISYQMQTDGEWDGRIDGGEVPEQVIRVVVMKPTTVWKRLEEYNGEKDDNGKSDTSEVS